MRKKENYFKETILTMTKTAEGKDLLSIIIGNYLSNRYGYCHFGFNFDTNGDNDGDPIKVFDIQWDVGTDVEVDSKLLRMLGLPEEVFINVRDLHLDDEYLERRVLDIEEQLEQQVLSDEELFIQEVLKLDDDVLQDILSSQEYEIQKALSDENE